MLYDFKPVLKILLRFILIYVALVLFYQFYLNGYKNTGLDPISQWVAERVTDVQNIFGYKSYLQDLPKMDSSLFVISGEGHTRMVEGCNAISVIILFLAFVFAFFKGVKTFVFSGLSVIFLFIINIFRIAGLNIIYVEYPKYSKIVHDYFFPAIIYGSVVLLWLIWIKYFALKNPDHENA